MDKTERVIETVERFNVRNGYGFINRNDTSGDTSSTRQRSLGTIHTRSGVAWAKEKTVGFNVIVGGQRDRA